MNARFYASCALLAVSLIGAPALPKSSMTMVHQEADRLEYDDKLKVMHLSGHVRLWQGDMLLQCDHAVYNLNSQEAEADGDLKMTGPDGSVTGDKLHVYYKDKVATVDGHVLLTYVPKKKTKPAEENPKTKTGKNQLSTNEPVTMTADELQYDWSAKVATASGNVILTQKDRKAYGDHAVFLENPEQLTMDGNVKLFRPPKDTLLCDHLVYQLESDHAVAEGHVSGTFLVKQQTKNETAKKGGKPAPKPSPTPTPPPAPRQGAPKP